MKNQYFGDAIDLFKYDLITEVINAHRSLKKFAYIPMLTPKDNRADGKREDLTAGYENKPLKKILTRFHGQAKAKPDFKKIEVYFKQCRIPIEIYRDNAGEYFSHQRRNDYFENIDSALLRESLVFIDPDNGLEVKNSNQRHVLYSELKDIFDRSNCIVMVIQFFPREKHSVYIEKRLSELRHITKDCTYIADSRIIFFFLCKSIELKKLLEEKVFKEYKERYPKISSVCGWKNYGLG